MNYGPCINCFEPVHSDEGLLVRHKGKVIAAVCATCTVGVKKPRVTLTRARPNAPFEPEQYSCVETFE